LWTPWKNSTSAIHKSILRRKKSSRRHVQHLPANSNNSPCTVLKTGLTKVLAYRSDNLSRALSRVRASDTDSRRSFTCMQLLRPASHPSLHREDVAAPRMEIRVSTFFDSYVSRGLLAPRPGLDAVAHRCRLLMTSLLDPYRPELHYMRGPGPKYREKLARRAETSILV
jgi:hypothetical protein